MEKRENQKDVFAGFIVRFAAFAVDFLVIVLISIVVGFFFAIITKIANINWNVETVSSFVGFLLNAGYYVFMTYNYGATIGKRVFGLKVKSVKDEKLDIGAVIVREIAGKFISIMLIGLGYLWIVFDRRKQGLHDKLAGTIVVIDTDSKIAEWKIKVIAGIFALLLVCFSVWIVFGVVDEEFQDEINRDQVVLSVNKVLVSGKLCVSEGNDIRKPVSLQGGGDVCTEKIGIEWPKLFEGYQYGKINNNDIFIQKNGIDIARCKIKEVFCELVE